MYLGSAAELVAAVERSIASEDRNALATNTHELASASLAAGALTIGLLGHRLEAVTRSSDTPVVIPTGHTDRTTVIAASKRGIYPYVIKPNSPK